jgi:hypothetical protein
MSLILDRDTDAATGADAFDRAVDGVWIVSEIAVDVFGMLFWGSLVLLFLNAAA